MVVSEDRSVWIGTYYGRLQGVLRKLVEQAMSGDIITNLRYVRYLMLDEEISIGLHRDFLMNRN